VKRAIRRNPPRVDINFDPKRRAVAAVQLLQEPQEAFSPAPQNSDQSCNLSPKSYPESFKRIYKEMAEQCKIILKKLDKAPIFVQKV
jgi:hypothetical protein